jgi:putative ABC transport system ATP-binding protein
VTIAAIEAIDVHKTYRRGRLPVEALRGVTMAVPPGQLYVVKGRSGAGKTTLITMLAGLDAPDSGRIRVGGFDVTGSSHRQLALLRRTTVSVIYQNFALLPVLTAEENVGVPLRLLRTPSHERDDRVAELLERVGLTDHARQRPSELSGGQMQRVAIARALAAGPAVLLADEPTAQLDSETGARVMTLMRELVDEAGMCALVTTHDPVVEERADGVLHLVDGTVTDVAVSAARR